MIKMVQNAQSFILLFFMVFTLTYVIHLSISKTQKYGIMQAKIRFLAGHNIERYKKDFDDIMTETLVETQVELGKKLYDDFIDSKYTEIIDRMKDILPYTLQKKVKPKVIQDIKDYLPTEIDYFAEKNRKNIFSIKKAIEKAQILSNELVPLPIPDEPDYIKADVNNLCSPTKKLKHHIKLLSYCVYGGRQIYYDGIDIVIRDARKLSLYKDWHVRVYHDGQIPKSKIDEYEKIENVHLCDARKLPRYGNISNILGKFWRVLPMADPSIDLFCPRDLDSNILTREEDAVTEFIKSGMVLHTMRDHRQHEVGMMAGMWCFHNRVNRTMGRFYLERLLKRAQTYKLRTDQPLLNAVIWDHISKYYLDTLILQHDSYNCDFYEGSRPWPTKRKKDNEFVGCPVHNCDQKLLPCPEKCRPSYGKIWKYC